MAFRLGDACPCLFPNVCSKGKKEHKKESNINTKRSSEVIPLIEFMCWRSFYGGISHSGTFWPMNMTFSARCAWWDCHTYVEWCQPYCYSWSSSSAFPAMTSWNVCHGKVLQDTAYKNITKVTACHVLLEGKIEQLTNDRKKKPKTKIILLPLINLVKQSAPHVIIDLESF